MIEISEIQDYEGKLYSYYDDQLNFTGEFLLCGKEITNVEIFLEFRGKGNGKKMIEEIFNRFPSVEYVLKVHFDNEIAQKLYKNLGFKYTGEVDLGMFYWMKIAFPLIQL